MRIFFLLLSLCLVTGAAYAEAPKEKSRLKMDGVFAVEGAAGGWSAIINGEVVSAGQTVEGYEVLSVDSRGAQVKDLENGQVEWIEPGAKKAAAPAAPPPPKAWWESLLEKHFPQLMNYKDQMQYGGVIKDLRKIHFEAMQYSITEGRAVSISELVAKGKLPPSFARSTSEGYHFTIQNLESGGGVRIQAEPLEEKTAKRHFFMDEHSYIYSELGREATQRSPRFGSGYTVSVLAS